VEVTSEGADLPPDLPVALSDDQRGMKRVITGVAMVWIPPASLTTFAAVAIDGAFRSGEHLPQAYRALVGPPAVALRIVELDPPMAVRVAEAAVAPFDDQPVKRARYRWV